MLTKSSLLPLVRIVLMAFLASVYLNQKLDWLIDRLIDASLFDNEMRRTVDILLL